ncbi:HSP70 nucleotide exchange factor FES1-like protein [Tanacetum coccineum]|uniref:HSP70 nucleotide exchange factor FES1-like protein n=1 Tax=Tanacetum coccineum TaxID=301880 RepID=A0ABQ5I7A1_9ASTR
MTPSIIIQRFHGVRVRGVRVHGVRVRGVRVGGVRFDVRVRGVRVGGVRVRGVQVRGVRVGGVRVGGVRIRGVRIQRFRGVRVRGVRAHGVRVRGVRVGGVRFDVRVRGVRFGGLRVGGVRVHDVRVGGVRVGGVRVRGVQVRGIRVGGVRVGGVRIRGVRAKEVYKDVSRVYVGAFMVTMTFRLLFERWEVGTHEVLNPYLIEADVLEEDRKWFMEAMQAQTIDVVKRMKEITLVMQTHDNVLEEQGVSASDLEGMLDELQKHVEPIHMANDLHTIGGLPPLLKYLRNSHANIQAKAAEVVSTIVQNNPKSQQLVMDANGMEPLLTNFNSDDDVTVRTKANIYQRDVLASSWFSKPNSHRKKKVGENKTAGAGEGAAGMSTIHMDDDEVPKLVVCDRRKDSSEPAGLSINGPSIAATPYIRRISLRMSVIALQNYTTYEVCISTGSPSLRLAAVFIFSNVVLVFRWVAAIVFGSVVQKPNSSSKKDNGDSDNIMSSCKLFGFALTEVPQLLYAKGLSNRSLLKHGISTYKTDDPYIHHLTVETMENKVGRAIDMSENSQKKDTLRGLMVLGIIAKAINNKHKKGDLKLEDVAMGIWIAGTSRDALSMTEASRRGASMSKGGSTYNMSAAPVTVFVHLLVISITTLTLVWLLKFHGGFAFKADHFHKNKIFNIPVLNHHHSLRAKTTYCPFCALTF